MSLGIEETRWRTPALRIFDEPLHERLTIKNTISLQRISQSLQVIRLLEPLARPKRAAQAIDLNEDIVRHGLFILLVCEFPTGGLNHRDGIGVRSSPAPKVAA